MSAARERRYREMQSSMRLTMVTALWGRMEEVEGEEEEEEE